MELKMRNLSLRIKFSYLKINSAFQENAVGMLIRLILLFSKLIFQSVPSELV